MNRWVRVTERLELNRSNLSLRVSILQSQEDRKSAQEKRIQCVWVTDVELAPEKTVEMACATRARWKIEKQTFNALKTWENLEHACGQDTNTCLTCYPRWKQFLLDKVLKLACPSKKGVFGRFQSR